MGNTCSKIREAYSFPEISMMDISQLDKGIVLSTGRSRLTNEKLSEIIDRSKNEIKQNENNSKAHLTLGICLYAIGYYDASEEHLTKSLHLEKLYQSTYVLGLINISKNNLKKSESYFKACIRESQFCCAYIKLGEGLLRRNKYSLARKVIKQSLVLNPENAELMTILGMAYMPSNLTKALKYSKLACKMDESLFKPYVNIAEIKKGQAKYERAIKYCLKALGKANSTQKGFAQLLLASVYFELGNLEEAISYCKQSISSNPSLITVIKERGFDCIFNDQETKDCIQLIISKEFNSAVHRLRQLYKKDKHSIPICYFLAISHFESGDLHRSIRYYKKIISLSAESENTQLAQLLLARAEIALKEILENENENGEKVEEESCPRAIHEEEPGMQHREETEMEMPQKKDMDEDEPLITLEGSLPNFSESLKSDEISENVAPIKDLGKDGPSFLPAKKNTSIRQFVSSADPEPGNCYIY